MKKTMTSSIMVMVGLICLFTLSFTDKSSANVFCCNHDGIRGDANYDNDLNISDLVFLVNYLFKGGDEPPCFEEADVDKDGDILVTDLTYMVDYLFKGGFTPSLCDNFEVGDINIEAAWAAIWLKDDYIPQFKFYEQIFNDLTSIREQWQDSIPIVSMEFTGPWIYSELNVGVTDGALDSIIEGTYHHWDEFNTQFGFEQFTEYYPGFIKLEFTDIKNPVIMKPSYIGLPGFESVYPHLLDNDRPMLLMYQDGNQMVYFFRNAWGDCPSGCIYEEFNIFTVTDNIIEYQGFYPDKILIPQPYALYYQFAWAQFWDFY